MIVKLEESYNFFMLLGEKLRGSSPIIGTLLLKLVTVEIKNRIPFFPQYGILII